MAPPADFLQHPVVLISLQTLICCLAQTTRTPSLRFFFTHLNLPIAYLTIITTSKYARAPWGALFAGTAFMFYSQLLALKVSSTPPPKSITNPSASIFTRLTAALDNFLDCRRTTHPPIVAKVAPFPHDKIPSKASFISTHLIRFAITYLMMDAIGLNPLPEDRSAFYPERVPIITNLLSGKHVVTPADFITRIIISILFWFYAYLLLQLMASGVFIVTAALDLAPYDSCRPVFGSVFSAYTIRDFWGTFWHQLLRFPLPTLAEHIVHTILGIPPKWRLVSRYAKLFVVFGLSGAMHLAADIGTGLDWRLSGSMHFFLMQAVGIMFEDGVRALFTKPTTTHGNGTVTQNGQPKVLQGKPVRTPMWQRIFGYLWLISWMAWTVPGWSFPQLLASKGENTIPFSIIQWKATT